MTTAIAQLDRLTLRDGRAMRALAAELYPICRSITGDGLRATLRRIQQEIPLTLTEVPSGTGVLDWTIPDEWNIRDAWIADSLGRRVVDFQRSNLHVVNYSTPIRGHMSWEQLRPHLHSLPSQPDLIPYRTSYYQRTWGFCLAHRDLLRAQGGEYDICIDSSISPGSLTYGELLVPGESSKEILVSAHCCHPSLADDNLSGIVVAAAVAQRVLAQDVRPLSVRFIFAPGTIGAITWLAQHRDSVRNVVGGLVLTCVGDSAPFTYKLSRRSTSAVDLAARQVLSANDAAHRILDFSPIGYDERQYCSPGFNLPVGCLMRSQHGTFPQYHTSADNLDFITANALEESVEVVHRIIEEIANSAGDRVAQDSVAPPAIEADETPRYVSLRPYGEPQLGKYGVYAALDGDVTAALWVLNFSDGKHSLAAISKRSGVDFDSVVKAANVLLKLGLIREGEGLLEAV